MCGACRNAVGILPWRALGSDPLAVSSIVARGGGQSRSKDGYMSYGLELGWGGPTRRCAGDLGRNML